MTTGTHHEKLRIVVTEERDEKFSAQSIEHWMTGQGDTARDAARNLLTALGECMLLNLHRARRPLEGLEGAPDRIVRTFQDAAGDRRMALPLAGWHIVTQQREVFLLLEEAVRRTDAHFETGGSGV